MGNLQAMMPGIGIFNVTMMITLSISTFPSVEKRMAIDWGARITDSKSTYSSTLCACYHLCFIIRYKKTERHTNSPPANENTAAQVCSKERAHLFCPAK